jgi:LacI family gluconate utilization system Gnt-I transcriptional repressor
LTQALAETDLQLLLGITNYRVDEEERHVRQLLARRPEAIVLTGGHHTEATRKLLSAMDVPVVEIWDLPPDPIGHVVGFSNAAAMSLVVDHLVATGRQKLGFLGATGDTDKRGAERLRGVVSAACRHGLPEVKVMGAGPAPVSMTDGASAIDANLDQLRSLDALVCVSDPVAFGALMALRRSGFCIPDDLAVTGFGAFEIAQISIPKLTTVNVWSDLIGRKTGKMINRLMDQGVPPSERLTVALEPELIRGSSS